MKKIILLFIVLTFSVYAVKAQTLNHDYLDINNIKALVNSRAIQFFNDTVGKYEFPKGSGKNSMSSSSIWIGGTDVSQQLHLASDLYNTNGTDFWSGPLTINGTATISTSQASLWNKVWKVSKAEINYFILHHNDVGYVIPPAILNWPWRGDITQGQTANLAPYVDVNGDYVYNPNDGDYPLIYGDQCIFFVINDAKTHLQTQGLPIGVEIQVFAYAFNTPNDTALNNTIFYKYKVINRSTTVLSNCYIGLFSDIDIGNPLDDYIGCDVKRSMYYGYNATATDAVYGNNPPAQGVLILGGPYMDPDAIDNPKYADTSQLIQICDASINGLNFENSWIDDERLGMSRFQYFDSSNGSIGLPSTTINYASYLKGVWKDNTNMVYGGTGYYTSAGALANVNTNFAFPGTSDSTHWGTGCGVDPIPGYIWTEQNAGTAPGDRKGIASSGSFTLKYNQAHYFDIAYTSAFGNGTQTSVNVLNQYADHIRYLFLNDTNISHPYNYIVGVKPVKETSIKIYPNPVVDYLRIETNLNTKQRVEIINLVGQTIYTSNFETKTTINASILPNGIYLLKLNTGKETIVKKFIKQ